MLNSKQIKQILKTANTVKPNYIIIDSIQTIYNSDIQSAAGNINQVRECTMTLLEYSKKNNVVCFIIGHITKTGEFAGPRVLEHLVDTVLYFEGEKTNDFRILRSIKNRFGATNEIAVFEMSNSGLVAINNYANLFYFNRLEKIAGVSNTVIIEGVRPITIEIQALVSNAVYGNARRVARGFNLSRLAVIIAIIEKHCNQPMFDKDVFVNITGGLEITEPAADLAVAIAIMSSLKNRPINVKSVFIGELGLTGEVRAVSRLSDRLKECLKNEIKNCIVSNHTSLNLEEFKSIKLHTISNIKEIMKYFEK